MAQLLDIYCSGDATIDGEIYTGTDRKRVVSLDKAYPIGTVFILQKDYALPSYFPGTWKSTSVTLGSLSCIVYQRTA